jgi:hypothetical protein
MTSSPDLRHNILNTAIGLSTDISQRSYCWDQLNPIKEY